MKRKHVVGQVANYVPEEKHCGLQRLRGVLWLPGEHHLEAPAISKDQVEGRCLWWHCCHRIPPDFFFSCFNLPQDTLAYATALLNEKEQSGSSNGSEGSPANENGDRHLQQV